MKVVLESVPLVDILPNHSELDTYPPLICLPCYVQCVMDRLSSIINFL